MKNLGSCLSVDPFCDPRADQMGTAHMERRKGWPQSVQSSKRIVHDLVTEQQLHSSDFILFKNYSSGGINKGKNSGNF